MAILRGKWAAHCKSYGPSALNCAKTAEPIEMLFGLWTQVSTRKRVLDGVHSGATWRIQLNHPCGSDAAFCQINLTKRPIDMKF